MMRGGSGVGRGLQAYGRSALLTILTTLALSAGAQTPASPAGASKDIEERLNRTLTDAKALDKAVAAGRRAAFLCVHCHGEDGNSPLDHVPNLAGQNAAYLLAQIDRFGDGRRQDEFMSGLVKMLKAEDRFNIAVFYAVQPVRPAPAKDARLQEQGRAHYVRACVGCHGAQARGSREVARLAGQQPGYLRLTLAAYRAGSGLRADPRMASVARKLTDPEIAALAAYLSAMR